MNLKKNFNKIENFIFGSIIIIFLLFSLLILFTNLISDQIFEIKLKSFLLLFLPSLSLIFYFYDKNRESIPLFYFYFFYFSIPAGIFGLLGKKYKTLIFSNIDNFILTDKIFIESLDITLLFCFIFSFIFFLSKFLIKDNFKNKILEKKQSIKIFHALIPFVAFLFFILIDRKNFVNQMNIILFPLAIFSSLLFYHLFLSSKNSISKFTFIFPILIVLIHYLLNWTLLNLIIILISLLILEIRIKNKLNLFIVLLIFIIPISLSKMKNEIRYIIKDNYIVNETKNDNFQNKSLIERFRIIPNFFINNYMYSFDKQIDVLVEELKEEESRGPFEFRPMGNNLKKKSSLDFFLLRLTDNNFNFSKMIYYKDDEEKFIKGESLFQILTSFIPRIIWTEKPSMSFGSKFGKTFKIITVENNETSINISWFNEFYWNFRLKGIIFGSIVIGFFIICINYISNRLSDFNYIIVLSSISMILIPESNLSIYLSYSVKSFILLYVIGFLINKTFYKNKLRANDIIN
tara:strand:- start:2310 stop:3863 length:1554 start_codon:yes stop_codon:yes gene_type:complete